MESKLFANGVTVNINKLKLLILGGDTYTSIEGIYTVLLINPQFIIQYDANIEPQWWFFSSPICYKWANKRNISMEFFLFIKEEKSNTHFVMPLELFFFQGFYMYNCTLSSLDFLNFRVLSLIDTSAVFTVIFFSSRKLM